MKKNDMIKKVSLFSFFLGGLLSASSVYADEFSMHTTAAVGEKISIALNENVRARLVWGDGTTEEHAFDGLEAEFTVKHADVKIVSDDRIECIYCPDCSLTKLDLVSVPRLYSLICSDNQLTTLDLEGLVLLETLNCEGNAMKTLTITDLPRLRTLNCADNQLTKLNINSATRLRTLICSNNDLSSLTLFKESELESVWCHNNRIQRFDIGSHDQFQQFVAFNNRIITLPIAKFGKVTEMWVDNNRIKTLDLSENDLKVLSASHNALTSIILNRSAKKTLEAFYVDDNKLMFDSYPTLFRYPAMDTLIVCNIDSQALLNMAPQVEINKPVDLTEYMFSNNAWGASLYPRATWYTADGTVELVKNEDYTEKNKVFTFLKPFSGVYAEISSRAYPQPMRTEVMQVVDPTAIDEVGGATFEVSAEDGLLRVVAGEPTPLHVYNACGVLCVSEQLEPGSHSWNLPAGVYVVNGQKVAVK